ncbi:MAG: L,D-transpeptidase/peptidoglycan binding protein [Lachnospiraceae bacterium]|nr:L,D-transpeptidase/peptidoglycan binding protein [Lachnospiraceae bacterium]
MIDAGRRGRSSAKKNILLRLAAMYGVSAILGMGTYYGYRFYCESNNGGFLKGTVVDGEDVYGMSVQAAQNLIEDKYADSEIVITEKENEDLRGNLAFYGYEIDSEKLQSELQTVFDQQKSSSNVLRSIFDRYECKIDARPQENTEVFEKQVRADALEVARYPSEDARLYYDSQADALAIKDEIQGNEIPDTELQDFVRQCITQTLDSDEDLHESFEFPWELCARPQVYRDDAGLIGKRDAVNEYAGAGLTYTFGEEQEVYDLMDISELFMEIKDGKAELSEEKIEDFVEKLAAKYDTRYIERKFESTLRGEITIKAARNDYGYTILQEDEAEQIMEDIESRSHVTREPVYLEKNSWGNPYYLARNGVDDLDGTYIEVDLSAQHVWFYKDGEVYTECNCVSGDVTNDHGTQTGCFPLAYKESPSVLTGGNGEDEYETKVNYWMPFYEGQGLHDATWRYSFGGNIYRGNGSHGCVNIPLSAARDIYEAVDTGTAIIIFY